MMKEYLKTMNNVYSFDIYIVIVYILIYLCSKISCFIACEVIRFTAWGIFAVASDYFKSIGGNIWGCCLEYILEKGRASRDFVRSPYSGGSLSQGIHIIEKGRASRDYVRSPYSAAHAGSA